MAQPPKPPVDFTRTITTTPVGDADDPTIDQVGDVTRPAFELPEDLRVRDDEPTPPPRAQSAPVQDDSWDFPDAMAEGTAPPPEEVRYSVTKSNGNGHHAAPSVEVDLDHEVDLAADVLSSAPAQPTPPQTTPLPVLADELDDEAALAAALDAAAAGDAPPPPEFQAGAPEDHTGETTPPPEVRATPRMIETHTQPGIAPAPAPAPARASSAVPVATAAAAKKPMRTAPAPEPPPARNTVPREAVAARPTSGEKGVADHAWFRQESQRLARARDWQKLATLSAAAIESAPWAELPETRSALLLELARLYRDRLVDPMGAEETFRRLAQTDAAHAEAIDFLSERYRQRSEWKALHDLFASAVEATWDPEKRKEWTRNAVEIARDKLASDALVIQGWERLWQLGESDEEAARALIEIYRRSQRWDKLADFLRRRSTTKSGAERIAGLREVAEIYVSGLRDPERASEVLGAILSELPEDPIALMAEARVKFRRGDLDGLAALAQRPLEAMNQAAALDLLRLVGDALWSSGRVDDAMRAWDRILAMVPDDVDGLRAKEEALVKTARVGELIDFFAARVERAANDDARCELLTRAAKLAERELSDRPRAIALWEKVLGVKPKNVDAVRALVELHDLEGHPEGVARMLEEELALTRDPEARREVLRKIGDHAAKRTGDSARAESAWQELLVSMPDDGATWDALIELYRTRGDYEGIDRALSVRAFRPATDATMAELWLKSAHNVEAMPNKDAARAARAWLRVLDLTPDDVGALGAACAHHAELDRPHEHLALLEAELAELDTDLRVPRALELAKRWEDEGDRAAAHAAYERVLRWKPDEGRALEGLGRVAGDAPWVVATALEAAAAGAAGDLGIELLRIRIEAQTSADALARFFELRRILRRSSEPLALLDEVADAADRAGAHGELVALLGDLAAAAPDEAAHAKLLRRQATLLEEKLREPVRALLALDAIGRRPVDDAATVDAIARLADVTNRHEDLLAVLDVQARGADRDSRRKVLERRAAILTRLGDAGRAFHEQTRLLALDPTDAGALAEARRHAEAGQLWRQLDALYGELYDRATDDDARVALARQRAELRRGPIGDSRGALEQLLVAYRLDPAADGLEEQIRAAARAENVWPRVLPILEARVRSTVAARSVPVDALLEIAGAWEEVGAAARAFELTCAAAPYRPDDETLRNTLDRRAQDTDRHDVLALVLRRAAARAGDRATQLALLARVASIYDGLERPGEALDIHRRVLQLDDRVLPSLEAVITHLRKAGLGRQLQQSQRAWLAAAPADAPGRLERLLEIAEISRDQLGDVAAALDVYAEVLAIKPDDESALAGMRAASTRVSDPALELKLLRMELDQAQGARRVELLLAYAGIEHKRLGNLGGAIATLQQVIAETGPTGRGYEPLAEVLRARAAWAPLVDLTEQRALAVTDAYDRLVTLRKALALCEEHPTEVGAERFERIAGRLLEGKPDDREVRRKLAAHYRRAERHEELARVLTEALLALPAGNPAVEDDRVELEAELARLYDRALGRREEAEKVLAVRLARRPGDATALLHQASIRRRAGELEGYVNARRDHAKGLPKTLAAIALCHLAEACDDTPGQQARVAGFYRDARGLDAQNPLITEALKAIGRRAKGWRTHAALLPDPEEARLSWAERATRLLARAEAARVADPAGAIAWVERAVMVDPDSVAAWDAMASCLAEKGDTTAALEAQRQALAAFERANAPTAASQREHAERLQGLADWADDAGLDAEALRASERAHDLAPAYPPACLAAAARLRNAGDHAAAHALYQRALEAPGEPLSDEQRLEATYRRGALAAQLGRHEEAIADLRAALRLDPLHPGALSASADVLIATGRVGSAAQHLVQALLVAHEPDARGPLYARLARLWEETLARPDEASVCYELAIAAGVEDRDVMARGLRLSRQYGRGERALAVIEQLLPRTTDGRELAQLWAEKGELLSQGREALAIEAYDMALSYDQSNARALSGLLRLLERRGEWEQVIELLSARLDGGTPGEKAEAKRSLTRVARELDRSKNPDHHALSAQVKAMLNPAPSAS